MMLELFEKSGCVRLHPCGVSERPSMVNRSCTPPSGVPSGFLMKRTSRTGPFAVIKEGSPFCEFANATCGFETGLDPPTAGCAWHDEQELELKRGPRPPCGTFSTS